MIALNEHMPLKAPKNKNRWGQVTTTVGSMKDVERVWGIPASVCKIIRDSGKCPEAFDGSNRVNVIPLFKFIGVVFRKIPRSLFMEKMGADGFADLDKDEMQARVSAQVEIEKMRENALANKQLLTREGVEKALSEPLMAVAMKWKNYEKDTGSKIKSLLMGAGVSSEIIQQTLNLACNGVSEPIEKLRESLEAK